MTDRARMQAARERFLAGDDPNSFVRPEIVQSWRRSQANRVDPEAPAPAFEPDRVAEDSRLSRAATPVLDEVARRLGEVKLGTFLADGEARGLARWCYHDEFAQRLDALGAARGFRFDEELAGTNSLGTVLEERRALWIRGPEHWAEALADLDCFAAPVQHPITGQLEGIVNLTFDDPRMDDSLAPLTLEAVRRIQERLYDQASRIEQQLLQSMLVARSVNRAVVAMNEDIIISSPAAARLLEGIDQPLLWEQVCGAITGRSVRTVEFSATPDRTLTLECRPIHDESRVVGAVVALRAPAETHIARQTPHAELGLPGLVGRSGAWMQVVGDARRAMDDDAPVIVSGPAGAGKLVVAQAMAPAAVVVDCALIGAGIDVTAEVRAMLESGRDLVLQHLGALDETADTMLAALLDRAAAAGSAGRVLATDVCGARPAPGAVAQRLAVHRVDVPGLDRRGQDIPLLVDHLLEDLAGAGRCRTEAVQLLIRQTWPGNVRELRNALRYAVSRRASGDIRAVDLPAMVRRQGARRSLSAIERAELDAITAALDAAGGNKVEAALAVGVSRSTLYRKLKAYGLNLESATY